MLKSNIYTLYFMFKKCVKANKSEMVALGSHSSALSSLQTYQWLEEGKGLKLRVKLNFNFQFVGFVV